MIRILFILTMTFCFFGSETEAKEQYCRDKAGLKYEKLTKRKDGWQKQVIDHSQSLVGTISESVPMSHSISSSRSHRVLPTHGGRASNPQGRWAKSESFNPHKHHFLLLRRYHLSYLATASSPLIRYVIALRRFLC